MIKVLRLMEYTFDDYEALEKHFGLCQVPVNGGKDFGPMTIRSSILISPFKGNEVDKNE